MRSHYCGQVNETLLGRDITVAGWVHRRRDHGGVIFVDLRDREGLLQIVFDPEAASVFTEAERLRNEFVVRVTGRVRERPPGTVNANLASGRVELVARELELLNRSEPLPFQLDEQVGEEVRLRYRYLGLRREVMSERLRLRHRITRSMRGYLDTHGFIDLETPMLTKATPEGARDYLVPSRTHPGKFFALPQSPQIFKQLLMISGFDRYYQIVRCFRDEDLRADRQTAFVARYGARGLAYIKVNEAGRGREGLQSPIIKFLSDAALTGILERTGAAHNDLIFFGADSAKVVNDSLGALRLKLGQDLKRVEGGWRPLWVVDFPMFEWDADEQRWVAMHHPFTSPRNDDSAAPPHGGIAFGLDRLAMLMTGADSIREVIAFPKTQTAADPLTDAPTEVSEAQLRELHIRVRVPRP